jgi:hypothetical protein
MILDGGTGPFLKNRLYRCAMSGTDGDIDARRASSFVHLLLMFVPFVDFPCLAHRHPPFGKWSSPIAAGAGDYFYRSRILQQTCKLPEYIIMKPTAACK